MPLAVGYDIFVPTGNDRLRTFALWAIDRHQTIGEMSMGPTDFAVACREQRDLMLANYADASGGAAVAALLAAANLSQEQRNYVVSALDTALTDAFYTMLLAIDGSTSLGQTQQSFTLTDGEGNMIANGDGRLEAAAWEALQSNQ